MYERYYSKHFKKQLKKLKKKFVNIKDDVDFQLQHFDEGTNIYIGSDVYKIRIPSSDMKKGKSGAFRCYIYVLEKEELLTPLCIYSKNVRENLSHEELNYHMYMVNEDLKVYLKSLL